MSRNTKSRDSMRLARYIAQAGIAARRKAEDLIRQGHVRVNGEKVTNVATNVVSGQDEVSVKGTSVLPEPLFYAVLNKPKGCITSLTDPWDRPTVMDYLVKVPATVKPVGRLDFYSEGVLLFTNDGDLAAALLGPNSEVEKTYHVKVRGKVPDSALRKLRSGVRIGAKTVTREAQVDRLKAASKHDWLVITLTEGKSRQIHRMLEALLIFVTKIQRVAFAGIHFHGLRVGDARELNQAEVNELRKIAGLPKSSGAAARGTWSAKREDTEMGRRAKARLRAEREGEEAERAGGAALSDGDGPSRGGPKPATRRSSTVGAAAGGRGKPARGKPSAKPSRPSKPDGRSSQGKPSKPSSRSSRGGKSGSKPSRASGGRAGPKRGRR